MSALFAPRETLVLTADEVGALDHDALGDLLDVAAARGIGDVIVEIDEIAAELSSAVEARGLRLLAGVTCFHEHGQVAFGAGGARRPIGADGRPRDRLEWYVGLLPTDSTVVAEIMARCARLARTPGVSGLVLDFIRWPLHWELELRADGPQLPPSSFDGVTLRDFREWSGCEVSADPVEAAGQIAARHRAEWNAYRADTISRLVRRISEVAHADGVALGAFVLPLGRESVGQDVAAWEGAVDALYPMAYHSILHRPAHWVGEVVTQLQAEVAIPVVPIVQLTASAEYSGGWDWGSDVDDRQLSEAIAAAGASVPVGFFPGTALPLLPAAQPVGGGGAR